MATSLDHATTPPCLNCNIFKLLQDYARRIEEVEKTNSELASRISELEAKLAKYESPHTPSSAQRFKKEPKGQTPKKRGAPKGHRGATRKIPIPDETIPVPTARCPRCGQDPGDPVDTEEKIVEELESAPKIKVTKYILDKHVCRHCGHPFTARHSACPTKGNFGVHLLVYATMLKYHLRGPLRKVQDFMGHYNDFEISTKGVMDMLLRVGDACKSEYDRIQEKVRAANWRYIDETGIKINGEQWWLWIFRTDKDDVLTVIRRSRGKKVVDEILGEDHVGPDVVDGWRAYSHINIVQRGWAHLLREVDDRKDVSDTGRRLSEETHSMFDELKAFIGKDPPMSERKREKQEFEEKMEDLVERYSNFEELKKPVGYIRGGLGKWFTCLLYPGMEPTNNLGEQAMREHVIMRKIIGCFRSENGSQNYQYIASLFASWKLQGKNIFVELEKLLRRELCLA
ncbi:MAG: IS66 family transposase, partial [Candidatus Hydrothermarchaeales archaeon]